MLDHLHAISARNEHRALVSEMDALGPALPSSMTPLEPTPVHAVVRTVRSGRRLVATFLARAAVAIAPDHVAGGHVTTVR